jgi:mRNA interferase RelE/StbE
VPFDVRFAASAARDLATFPRVVQERIRDAVLELQEDPRYPNVIRLSFANEIYRRWVGDYRIVFRIEANEKTLTILCVGHRSSVYRRLGWDRAAASQSARAFQGYDPVVPSPLPAGVALAGLQPAEEATAAENPPAAGEWIAAMSWGLSFASLA